MIQKSNRHHNKAPLRNVALFGKTKKSQINRIQKAAMICSKLLAVVVIQCYLLLACIITTPKAE